MTKDRNSQTGRDTKSTIVLAVECLKGSSKADEWTGDMLQTGDIVEEILIGSGSSSSGSGSIRYKAPFKNGKRGVQKILHNSFKNKETSIVVRARRGRDGFAELHACVVPEPGYKNKYVLRSIEDPNYAFGFTDRSEAECSELQDSRSSRIVSALQRAKLQDGYVDYPWEKRMQELLQVPKSSSFLSLLLLPKASDGAASRYNDLEDTLARAHAWLCASQVSGVPVVFMNIQTESLLTKVTTLASLNKVALLVKKESILAISNWLATMKSMFLLCFGQISGETASSTVNAGSLSDFSGLANVSLYGFEDYHGVDLGVVRAARLWYAPLCGEFAIEVRIKEDDTKLGFAISRTEEGFIYISSVMDDDENVPSTRSGLSTLYKEAKSASRLLVVSRVSNQKVLPWMVSSTGAVKCFDIVSLSQKLSLHRHAKVPILIHVFSPSAGSGRFRSVCRPPVMAALPPEIQLTRQPGRNQIQPLTAADIPNDGVLGNEADIRLDRDTAGETSFRFHCFSLPNN